MKVMHQLHRNNFLPVYIHVFLLGFVSALVQIVMLREFMFVFGGNELIIGVVLAGWMVLTGTGAFVGKTAIRLTKKPLFTPVAMILLGWIPPVLFFMLEFFRNKIFSPGIEIGFFQIMLSTVFFIAPFCLLSGFLFTHFAMIISQHNISLPAEKTYATEAAGSLVAGVIASFILVYFLTNFQALILLPVYTSLVMVFPIEREGVKKRGMMLVIATIFASSVLFLLKTDYWLKSVFFARQEILYIKDTPYGNLTVTRSSGQLNIFDNGKLLFSTDNQIGNEEAVHYAMAQHPHPRHILLISGGISGITHEVLKYDIERIDYVEINPQIFTIGRKYTTSLNDTRINAIQQDARLFVQQTTNRYDIILINLPEPSTAHLNRYYTVEFLTRVREIMQNNCIIALNMPSTANYLSDEAVRLNSIIFNTCRSVFRHVLIIPGERNYYLASDNDLTLNISQLIDNKNIKNYYLNSYYIDSLSLQERSDYLLKHLKKTTQTNQDFKPVSYFYYLGYWLSQFNITESLLWIIFVLLIAVLLVAGIFFKPVTSALMITGFSASSLEIVLLLALQILSGYIYQVIGLCIAVFMGGMALGALSRARVFRQATYRQFTVMLLLTGLVALLIPKLLVIDKITSGTTITLLVVLLLLFIIAFATGVLFSMSINLRTGNLVDNIAVLYSADLIGSALGAFLTSIFLIPLLGLMNTSYLIGSLLMIFALYGWLRQKYNRSL